MEEEGWDLNTESACAVQASPNVLHPQMLARASRVAVVDPVVTHVCRFFLPVSFWYSCHEAEHFKSPSSL